MLREVRVENGLVRGLPAADPRITAFKGIPFAAPPVGELRWKAPQPAKDWDGVLEAYHFAPIAMQEIPGEDPNAFYSKEWHVDPTIPMSEDCLYLNVWTPAKSTDEKLPVMVWIFGGGLRVGYPSEMEFDGERIARRGVILVTVNYRLNAFGFLCHPELRAEDPEFPTNFGHLDQRAGIAWVKRNIAAFGGDPENITIFGQSAGGGSTMNQVCSPLNKGLFQKAVAHSSGGMLPPALLMNKMEDAEENGKRFLEALGVKTIEEARKIDAVTIRDTCENNKFFFGTVVGDSFMPEKSSDIILGAKRNDVLMIIGNTEDEFPVVSKATSVEQFEAEARSFFGDRADEYLAICKKDGDDLQSMIRSGAYNRFQIGNLLWARANLRTGMPKMYLYAFDPEIPGDEAGSFHSSELWFVFETLSKCWRPFVGKHYDLARQMCNYWTNFAKTGDPNGKDADGSEMPNWRPISEGDVHPIFFGDVAGMDESENSDMVNFLISYYEEVFASNSEVKLGSFVRQGSTNPVK